MGKEVERSQGVTDLVVCHDTYKWSCSLTQKFELKTEITEPIRDDHIMSTTPDASDGATVLQRYEK